MDKGNMESVASLWVAENLHDEELREILSKMDDRHRDDPLWEIIGRIFEYDLYGKCKELFGDELCKAMRIASFLLMADEIEKGMRILFMKILFRLVFKPILDEVEADRTMVKTLTDIKEMNNGEKGE